jgi:hypothetical protein
MNATDIQNIGRFLRAINAVFNAQMAFKRAEAARILGNLQGNASQAVQVRLINLAIVELDDAIAVLQGAQGGALNSAAITRFQSARSQLITARSNNSASSRTAQVGVALNDIDLGDNGISANANFNIGAGTMMD